VSFSPTEEFTQRIEELAKAVHDADQWYQDHLLQLEALEQQSQALEAADRTLADALANREAERAQERVARRAERNREIEREKDQMVGEAQVQAERAITEATAKAIELVGDEIGKEIEQNAKAKYNAKLAEIEAKRKAERLKQLNREFDRELASIRRHLQPFITDGYTYRTDDKSGPVSLSVLEGQGALKEGFEGLRRLCYIGGTTKNGRDRGGFPMYIGGRNGERLTNWDFVQRAQDMIRKYGEVLVDRELLAK